MHIASIVSLIVLVGSGLTWVWGAVKNWKFNKNSFIVFVSIILTSIVMFAYCFEAKNDGLDISRHYQLLDQMKQGGWKFTQEESQYSSLFIYNTFAYLVAVGGNYAWLQTIPLIIDFAVFLYIYLDIIKRNNRKSNCISLKDSLFVFFLWISTFGLKLAITGIRCVLAVALCALAVYQEYILKKNKILPIALYVIALFIHNFALWVIAIRLTLFFKKKGFIAIALFLVIAFGEAAVQFLYDNVSNEYLKFVFSRILETFSSFQWGSDYLQKSGTAFFMMWGCFIILTLYLLYMSNYMRKYYQQERNLNKQHYTNNLSDFCYTVGLMGLPMAFNYLYMERYMYLVAWALLMIAYYYLKTVRTQRLQQEKHFWIMSGMSLVCLFVVFFNDIYLFMVNYIGFYFLAM